MKEPKSAAIKSATNSVEEIQKHLVYLYNIIKVQDARLERLQEKVSSVEEAKEEE